jgi:hypothetical protein
MDRDFRSKVGFSTSTFWKYGVKTTQSKELVRKELLNGTRTLSAFPYTMRIP